MQIHIISLTAKFFNLNFHPLKVVSRWRDPQLKWVKIIQIWQDGSVLFSNNATQFCRFANQICNWLVKYLYSNDKDV